MTVDFGPAFSLSGSLALTINTTAAPVDSALTVGGQTLTVTVPAGPYVAFSGTGLTLTVMGQTLTGDVMVEKSTALTASGTPDTTQSTLRLAATNVALTLSNGSDPVVRVTDGTALVVLTGTAVAGSISGTVAVQIPQVSVSGTLGVRFNTGTSAVDETFTVGSGSPQTLTISETQSVEVTGTGVTVTVLGQSFSGDFTVTRSGSPATTTITLANVRLALGGTTAAPLFTAAQTPNTTATLTLSGADVSGSISVGVTLAVPGVSITGSVSIAFDTATGSFSVGSGPNATPLTLTVFGQSLSGVFQIDRAVDASGASVVRVGISGGTLNLGPAGSPVVTATSVTGAVIVSGAGVAASLAATVDLSAIPNVTVNGAFQVQLNTGASAVDESVTSGTTTIPLNLPAGPYLRIAGTGLTLSVAGQSLQGDIGIEQTTSYGPDGVPGGGDDTTVVRIALANVSLHLGSGTSGLSLTDGSGAFIVSSAGVAGQVSGTVALTGVPGVSLSATVTASVNTTGATVNTALPIGSTVIVLDLPADSTFTVSGTPIELTVGGFTLRGDITFTQGTGAVTITVANGTLAFGSASSPLVSATAITGTLTSSASGVYGQLSANLAFVTSAVSLSSSVALQINTTGVSQTVNADTIAAGVRVVATSPQMVIGGLSVGADQVTLSRDASGTVAMSVTNLTLSLGSAVTITQSNGVSGAAVIGADGVAGVFTVTDVSGIFDLPGTVTGTVTLQLNTGTSAVSRPDLGIDLPGGPYFRVSLIGASLTLTSGPSFSGSFQITQDLAPDFAPTSTQTGASVSAATAFAVGDVTGDGLPDLVLGNASGATVFPGGGGSAITLTGGSGTVVGIGIADVNGDGLNDVVLIRGGSSGASAVDLAVPGGTFVAAAATLSTANATSFAIGDVNGDGLPDLLVGAGKDVSLFLNQATSTTLTAPVTATDTVLPVVDSSVFAASGSVEVGTETMTYTTGSSATITGATRGANSTTAASHASGATVTQGSVTTTLTAEISATDTTIPVASVAGFSATGSITIDSETIDYSSLQSSTLPVTRGAGATSHPSGAIVREWDGFAAATTVHSGTHDVAGIALADLNHSGSRDLIVATAGGRSLDLPQPGQRRHRLARLRDDGHPAHQHLHRGRGDHRRRQRRRLGRHRRRQRPARLPACISTRATSPPAARPVGRRWRPERRSAIPPRRRPPPRSPSVTSTATARPTSWSAPRRACCSTSTRARASTAAGAGSTRPSR